MTAPNGRTLLLVVDDNDTGRYAKSRILRQAGFEVLEATDGPSALQVVAATKPRLVVLDVNLPGQTGWEVCRLIKADPSTASVLVLQMSATYVQQADTVRSLEGGADGCLTEPVEPAVLTATIRALLRAREAEEALRASTSKLGAVIGATPLPIVLVDAEGKVKLWNPAADRVFGWQEAEVLGRPVPCILDDSTEDFGARLRAECASWETVCHRKDGSTIEVSVSTAPLVDADGSRGTVVVMADVTERKRAERERAELLERAQAARQEAETANRAKDDFLAMLSHELRSPLSTILTWTNILQGGTADAATTERALAAIERNTRLQTQLIADLLDVSRIISGKLTLDVHLVDLRDVVGAAADSVRASAEAKSIRLEIDVDPVVGPVSGDAGRLQQVVWNLLSNAVKFTPRGGRVALHVRQSDSHAEVVVTDTGSGIAPEFLPHVFERFKQADSSSSRSERGLGLGLAIVRHLVELHGGTVRAESPGEGAGSTFIVRLPLPPVRGRSLWRSGAEGAADLPSLAGVSVLVVDDDQDARDSIAAVLELCGARAIAVASVAEALITIEREAPDVLVSDIGIPEEDGYALIARVRALSAGRDGAVPAIALTGYNGPDDRRRILAAGYQTYLVKPIDPGELAAAVANLTRARR